MVVSNKSYPFVHDDSGKNGCMAITSENGGSSKQGDRLK